MDGRDLSAFVWDEEQRFNLQFVGVPEKVTSDFTEKSRESQVSNS